VADADDPSHVAALGTDLTELNTEVHGVRTVQGESKSAGKGADFRVVVHGATEDSERLWRLIGRADRLQFAVVFDFVAVEGDAASLPTAARARRNLLFGFWF
jgi:hypothetical protein